MSPRAGRPSAVDHFLSDPVDLPALADSRAAGTYRDGGRRCAGWQVEIGETGEFLGTVAVGRPGRELLVTGALTVDGEGYAVAGTLASGATFRGRLGADGRVRGVWVEQGRHHQADGTFEGAVL